MLPVSGPLGMFIAPRVYIEELPDSVVLRRTWWQIPPIAKVTLTGILPPGVTGKDVIVALCGLFNNDDVLNHAIEFTGDGLQSIPVDDRLAIANMTTEWGGMCDPVGSWSHL